MVLQPTCSDVDYKLVWKTTQEYLAQKGINNILWLYAPAKPSEYELETRCTSFIRLQYFRIDFAVRTILFESISVPTYPNQWMPVSKPMLDTLVTRPLWI